MKVTAAIFIEAIVIVGLIVSSLGIGAEGHADLQPDRTPDVATTPAPAPPPDGVELHNPADGERQ